VAVRGAAAPVKHEQRIFHARLNKKLRHTQAHELPAGVEPPEVRRKARKSAAQEMGKGVPMGVGGT